MQLWLHVDVTESARKRFRKTRQKELALELEPLDWQAIHARADAAGVSIFKAATVKGRFGGSVGARKKVSEIRADIVTVECARQVDNASFGSGSVQPSKRPLEHDQNDDCEDFLSR